MHSFIRINQEIVIQSDSCTLLIRIALENIVIYEFLTQIGVPLLFILLTIFWQANILTICDFVLPIIRFEAMEDILSELEVYI